MLAVKVISVQLFVRYEVSGLRVSLIVLAVERSFMCSSLRGVWWGFWWCRQWKVVSA